MGPARGLEEARAATLRRERAPRRLLIAADAVMALVALVVVAGVLGDDHLTIAALGAMPIIVVIHKIAGLYDRDHLVLKRSTLDEVPQLFQLTGVGAFVVTLCAPLFMHGTLGAAQALGLWAVSFTLLTSGRLSARRLARRISPEERCLLIGGDHDLVRIADKLQASGAHAAVVTTLPWSPQAAPPPTAVLRQVIQRERVDRVILAPAAADASALVDLIRVAKAAGTRVSVLPRLLEAVGSSMEFETLDGLTVLGVRSFGLPRSSRLLKRGFDLTGAAILLVAMAPVMAALAAAIRMDSRGGVFFRQTRVGRDGERFRIYKFRTMVDDAEARKGGLADRNVAGAGFFKIDQDPRVTRVGRLLRKTSLDELPQLFNVVRGEMSLVGPRPLIVSEDAQVIGLDRARLHLDPGMTGPWQVLGSSRIPIDEMVTIDYLYVANWSLWSDVRILLQTVHHVFGRQNR